eukprot:scaffold633_cov321-Pavlova_lutheri.AAC.27
MKAGLVLLLALPFTWCVRTPFLTAGTVEEGSVDKWIKPWFCHDTDCPKYKVLNTTSTYEVRKYAPGKWVSTDCLETHFTDAQYAGFYRLYKYISGKNTAKAKIPMATPVLSYVTPGSTPTALSNITLSFFLPSMYQDVDPPAPTTAGIYIEELPEMTVYVTAFGGWAKDASVDANVKTLEAAMDAEGAQ